MNTGKDLLNFPGDKGVRDHAGLEKRLIKIVPEKIIGILAESIFIVEKTFSDFELGITRQAGKVSETT